MGHSNMLFRKRFEYTTEKSKHMKGKKIKHFQIQKICNSHFVLNISYQITYTFIIMSSARYHATAITLSAFIRQVNLTNRVHLNGTL